MAESKTTQHWAVTVSRNGEEIVTIESNCLSGRKISEEDEKIIRMAANHLNGFVGPEYECKNCSDMGCDLCQ
jgi:hypothetical protein